MTDEPRPGELADGQAEASAEADAGTAEAERKHLAWWHVHRRLYNWVLHWAHTPYGTPALAVLAFCEASVLPAVPPDVLLVALSLSRRKRSLYYALLCSIFSVIGGMTGYMIGYGIWEGFARDIFLGHIINPHDFRKVQDLYRDSAFWAVFTAGLTPIPYIVFCIAGGVMKISFAVFLAASVVSRSLRFFAVATLIWIFGAPIKKFIDKYFNWVCLAFMVLLVGGFLIVKYAIR